MLHVVYVRQTCSALCYVGCRWRPPVLLDMHVNVASCVPCHMFCAILRCYVVPPLVHKPCLCRGMRRHPRRTLPWPDNSPTGQFPDRTIPRPDNSPTGQFPDRTIPRPDNSPTGQFPDRTIPRPDNSPAGQFPDRTIPRPDNSPTGQFPDRTIP